MNAKEVRDKVRDWAAGVMGVTTIHAYPNADPPAEPYAVVIRTMSDKVQAPPAGEAFVEAGGVISQVPLAETYWRFIIDVFGPDAEDHLQKIVTAYAVPTALWPLRPLVLVETTRIVTDADIRDQSFNGRAQMTIEVRGIQSDGLPIDVIEQQEPVFTPVY